MRRIGVIFSAILLMLLLPLQSLTSTANAQTLSLEKTWGGTDYDYGYGVAVDGSGNVYVTGETISFGAGYSDVVLLKYDSTGALQWQKTWGGVNNDRGNGVAVDGSGNNIYVTGTTSSFGEGGGDVVLLKFDAAGSLVWQTTYGGKGGDIGWGVAVYGDNEIYVTGTVYNSVGTNSMDIALLKFDSSGGLVWQETWGTSAYEEGYGVALDNHGWPVVTGRTDMSGDADIVVLFFDSGGGLNWQTVWRNEGTSFDQGRGVAIDDYDIYVTGATTRSGGGISDAVLLKFSESGSLQWQKTWGTTSIEEGLGVAVDGSGHIYVTGVTVESGASTYDVVLLRFDSSGALQWQRTWGGTSVGEDDIGNGVATHAGHVYFTGYTSEPTRSLGAVSGNVTTLSVIPTDPSLTLGTPNCLQGTPTFTPGTPSGNETYAGLTDIFLLMFSIPIVADLEGFASSPTNSTLLVVGDLLLNPTGHAKPPGVNYQQGRDTTPLGFVYGMMTNVQDTMFDTNAAINATTGRPLGSVPQTLIFAIGGPGINAVTHYYETTNVTEDRAPVRLGYDSSDFYWTLTRDGTEVVGSRLPQNSTSVPPGSSDTFVIQILRDADGRHVVLMYGTRYTGTWAAAVYFKFVLYANIDDCGNSYYIVRWTDMNGDCTPNIGDEFQIRAQGIA